MIRTCRQCGKNFENRRNGPGVICSRECRFWAKVQKSDGCWMWRGGKSDKRGYGLTCGDYAHRVSWKLHRGEIPEGLEVCHHCDNPSCVNPEHLFVGTRQDNLKDMARKGRQVFQRHPEKQPRGERQHLAKLTEFRVRVIREEVAAGKPHKEIAALFGITPTTVRDVAYRKTWKHIA